MKPDGIEAPVTPVLGTPWRSRDRARITAVGVIAIAVLGAGIGLAGNGLTSPLASPSFSATPGVALATPTPNATPTPSPLPLPTRNTGLGCAPVRLGTPPELRLGVDRDDPHAIRGSPAKGAGGGAASPPPAWPVPPVDGALRVLPATSIQLISEQDACMRYVVAEYVPGTPGVSVPFPIAFRTINVSPTRSIVPLGTLPSGDWIVRLVAYFSTGTAGQEDGTVVERFFRVINAETIDPIPTPFAPPVVPCTPPPPDGVPPTLVLSGSAGGLVEGSVGLVAPPVAPVRIGDLIEIRVDGDACAIAWTITATQPDIANLYEIAREDNSGLNPFVYSQNRWLLQNLPTGMLFVNATVRFSADVSVTRRWLLNVRGAAVPAVHIVAPDGSTVTALPGTCGASWAFAAGTSGFEYCAEERLPEAVPTLTVAPETLLRLDVPGWTIIGWGGTCGRSDALNSPGNPFAVVNACDLGGWYVQDGEAPPLRDPAVFLSRAYGPLVRIFVTAYQRGSTVTVVVFATITTAP